MTIAFLLLRKHSSEHTHMDYISNHLLELVQLLVEPGTKKLIKQII